MAVEDVNPKTPVASKSIANPINRVEEASNAQLPLTAPSANSNPADSSPRKRPTPREYISNVASEIASQPLQNSNPHVWGVLTAISQNARKRHQGINILLTADEHCIGRMVEDARFQINSNAISGKHCKIYRTKATDGNLESTASIFLKDTSSNGTYLNWEKLNKSSAAARVCHGDIISFAAPPQHESAFAFVYQEVLVSALMPDNAVSKRKAEEMMSENKRFKGIDIGAHEGPISLDYLRKLQRSNAELKRQLQSLEVLIDTLHEKNRTAAEHHENELKSVKESVAKCYSDQLKELQQKLDLKQKEFVEVSRVSTEQKHALEDVNERLSASKQSCAEANAIINSMLMEQCKELLKQLMTHQDGWIFNEPVDVEYWNIPDYFDYIKHPMDLGTVEKRLALGAYPGPSQFAADVRLTFSNAITYNPSGSNVHLMAQGLNDLFELRWKAIEEKLRKTSALPLPVSAETCEDLETATPMLPSKKRKTASLPPQPEVIPPAKPGIDLCDEDADIGGNEPPGWSCPSVEI